MRNKQLFKHRLLKSPFMLASLAGILAIIGDLMWAIVESLKMYTNIDLFAPLFGFLFILFPVCISMCIVSMKRYFLNGYIQQECEDELAHRREKLQTDKFKNLGNKKPR